jgi:hypothetical protein
MKAKRIAETHVASRTEAIRADRTGSGGMLLIYAHMIGCASPRGHGLREEGFTVHSVRSMAIDSISRFAVLTLAQSAWETLRERLNR